MPGTRVAGWRGGGVAGHLGSAVIEDLVFEGCGRGRSGSFRHMSITLDEIRTDWPEEDTIVASTDGDAGDGDGDAGDVGDGDGDAGDAGDGDGDAGGGDTDGGDA